jgi:phosphatidylglycerol:prolipoprotein diacylglycerol transferase
MINIGVNPIAFSLGFIEIRWYGIMVVLAVIAIIAVSILEARRMKISDEHVLGLAAWAIVSGMIMSRVLHIIDHWDYYMANPAQIVGFEGVAIYGAVVGVILAIIVYCQVKKLSIWQIGDMVSPGALVGMAIGRVGCVLNGCCYGLVTDSFCSVVYTASNTYGPVGIAVYPTQFFHIVWNLAAFALVWLLRSRLKPQGSIFLIYLALYAAGDLIVRTFRQGTPFLFGLQEAQLIGIIVLLVTVPWLTIRIVKYHRSDKKTQSSDGPTNGEAPSSDSPTS